MNSHRHHNGLSVHENYHRDNDDHRIVLLISPQASNLGLIHCLTSCVWAISLYFSNALDALMSKRGEEIAIYRVIYLEIYLVSCLSSVTFDRVISWTFHG